MMRRGRGGRGAAGTIMGALAVVMLVVVPAAGCAKAAPSPVSPTARVEQSASDAPAVRDARDARSADPCTLPTGAQLTALGVTGAGTHVTAPEGPRCEWHGRPELGITLYTNGGGIATLARNSEPTTSRVRLAGYPALETFTGTGEFCQYDVGVAANQVLSASLDGGHPDSCTALQTVLPAVVANLPALDG
jgi:Protein of unknown function (DUF3558)